MPIPHGESIRSVSGRVRHITTDTTGASHPEGCEVLPAACVSLTLQLCVQDMLRVAEVGQDVELLQILWNLLASQGLRFRPGFLLRYTQMIGKTMPRIDDSLPRAARLLAAHWIGYSGHRKVAPALRASFLVQPRCSCRKSTSFRPPVCENSALTSLSCVWRYDQSRARSLRCPHAASIHRAEIGRDMRA